MFSSQPRYKLPHVAASIRLQDFSHFRPGRRVGESGKGEGAEVGAEADGRRTAVGRHGGGGFSEVTFACGGATVVAARYGDRCAGWRSVCFKIDGFIGPKIFSWDVGDTCVVLHVYVDVR